LVSCGTGQALHYGGVTGQQPVQALISAYYNIFGPEQQKREYVSGLCAAHGVEIWALTTRATTPWGRKAWANPRASPVAII